MLLIIEVAHSSLNYDRAIKQSLYARHGIPEFWIVNLPGDMVEVHSTPSGDGYATVTCAGRGEQLVPALLPDVTVAVSDILG